jgi:chromosomal replication initiation ATPase DnaA
MGYLESLHEARKARLRRMAGAGAVVSDPKPNQRPAETRSPLRAADAQLVTALRTEIERLKAENARLSVPPARDPKVWKRPTIGEIKALVAKTYGVSVVDIANVSRKAEYVLPRMIAIHLARRLTASTLVEVGQRFGKRTHATARNANRRVLERRERDPAFDAELCALERKLAARPPRRSRSR